MKKKVVYLTHWRAKDEEKEYPNGWGFESPLVEFPQNMDPAEASIHCRELSNDEFECYGATPRELIDGSFEILGIVPGPDEGSEEWALRDISMIVDNADLPCSAKLSEINKTISNYFNKKNDSNPAL